MSENVTEHYVQQYTTNVQLLSQQKDCRFAGTTTIGNYTGKQGQVVDQFKPTVATKRTTRYPAIKPAEVDGDSRWVYPSDYDWAELLDSIDKLRMLIDPTSSYVESGNAAMNRAKDDEIIAAFFGTAKTGVDGSTSTAFPSSQEVSVSEGSSAATGLNVQKLKAGIKLLLANEAWDPKSGERIYCAITSEENDDLMNEIQVINADYNGERAVVNDGFVNRWGKIDFIHTERLSTDGSGYTRVPFWTKGGMHLGMWEEMKSDLSPRKDLAGQPMQIYLNGTFGATRIEEKKVVEIKCS